VHTGVPFWYVQTPFALQLIVPDPEELVELKPLPVDSPTDPIPGIFQPSLIPTVTVAKMAMTSMIMKILLKATTLPGSVPPFFLFFPLANVPRTKNKGVFARFS
jgi:hypothetical protein